MKPMILKPCKFDCKQDNIKGRLRRLGYRNWWENITSVGSNKTARAKIKVELVKDIQIQLEDKE